LTVTKRTHFDLLIMGAGIAGLSVAYAASKSGIKTAVIDRKYPGSGASGVPQALLNPATGRKAKKTWNAEKCLSYTTELLEEVQRKSGFQFYTNNGVIRPALDSVMAENMFYSYQESGWPDGWVEWLDSKELKLRFPGLNPGEGGLWIPVAGTVAFERFITALYRHLKDRGVSFFTGSEPSVSGSQPWLISGFSRPFTAENIVHATGESISYNPHWKMVSIHRVKGQTLTVEFSKKLPFRCSLSSLGYIAQGADPSGSVVLGSTYEHQYDHRGPDDKGASYLLKRLEKTVPDLQKNIRGYEGWSGIRVTTPDKKPFAGKHPETDNLYVLGALGSKGLMLGPYLGKLLSEYILHGMEIPPLFTVDRLLS